MRTHCGNEYIVCLPYYSDNILILNKNNNDIEKAPLDCKYILPAEVHGFALRFSVEYEGKIYAFGSLTKGVVVFDIQNRRIQYDVKLFEHIGLLTDDGKRVKYLIYISECSDDGKVILLMKNCEHLIEYTLHTQEVQFISSNPILSKCIQADFDGQFYWFLIEKNEKIIKWDPKKNDITEYYMSVNSFSFAQDNYTFADIIDCGNFILLLPLYGDKILKFYKITEKFSEYTEMPVPVDDEGSIYKYERSKQTGNKLYTLSRNDSTIYELDKLTNIVTSHKFSLDIKDHASYFSNYFESKLTYVNESNNGNIAKFFAASLNDECNVNLDRRNGFLGDSVNKDGTAGEVIYKYINEIVR